MVAPDGEHAEAAEQVEIAATLAVVEIRSLAFAKASSPHAYQSTGLCACWRRYGLVSLIRRFVCFFTVCINSGRFQYSHFHSRTTGWIGNSFALFVPLPLMIVHNLNLEDTTCDPSEANSPLIVWSDTILTHSVIMSKRFGSQQNICYITNILL